MEDWNNLKKDKGGQGDQNVSFQLYRLGDLPIAHRLAVEVHSMTLKELPKFETYEEASQTRRASKSVPANIAEGFGRRRYKAEYIRFLIYSLSSCDEMSAHLRLLKDTDSLALERSEYFLKSYCELGRKINAFISAVERVHRC